MTIRRRPAAPKRRPFACSEPLESRRLLATFTVTAGGDGTGFTLRSAVNLANATAGPDTIVFDPALFSGTSTTTIFPGSELIFSDTTGRTTVVGPGRESLAITGNKTRRPIRLAAGSDVEFRSLTIRDGYSNEGGAGILSSNATLAVRDVAFVGNQSTVAGSAIAVDGGTLTIDASQLSNSVGMADALLASNATVTISASRFVNNSGGGILSSDSNLTVATSTFSGNAGGGVYFGVPTASSTGVIRDSTFEGNSTGFTSPAILASGGGAGSPTLTLTNVTVVGNLGGGVSLTNVKTTLTHVTIARNASNSAAAGSNAGLSLNAAGSLVTLENTLIAGNTRPASAGQPSIVASDIAGTVGSASHTLVTDPASAGGIVHGTNGNIVGNGAGAALPANQVVAANAANNGGPVRTLALAVNGPAVNAGSTGFTAGVPFDARGALFARIVGGQPDLGAFEVQDLLAPTVYSGRFDADGVNAPGYPHRLTLQFSEIIDAATLSASDLVVNNLTTGQVVPTANMLLSWDPVAARATLVFPGYVRSVLPDGQYLVTVAAGAVADGSGNALAGSFSFDFFVLAGDANRDRSVNFADLLTLARNYGQTNKPFSAGNLDYDPRGTVDFGDLLLLAREYGATVAAPLAAAPAAPVVSPDAGRSRRPVNDILA